MKGLRILLLRITHVAKYVTGIARAKARGNPKRQD